MKERVVFGGCVVGLSVFLILAVYNVVIAGNSDDIYPIWNAVHEDAVKLSAGFNALVGAMMNLAYCTIVHLQFSGANDQDELITTTEYGPRLTHARIVDYMQKKFEPIFYKGGWARLWYLFPRQWYWPPSQDHSTPWRRPSMEWGWFWGRF